MKYEYADGRFMTALPRFILPSVAAFFNSIRRKRFPMAIHPFHPARILSPREMEIAEYLCRMSNRKIAETLHISYNTVRSHRKHIMAKQDVHTIQELLEILIEYGLYANLSKKSPD
jgi:DNA-binding CsgD family transcriptional regulator